MPDMSVASAAAAASQQNWNPGQEFAENGAPDASDTAGSEENTEQSVLQTLLERQEEESQSLHEMIQEAHEKAKAQQEAMERLPKNNTRYGDAPLEAYARLARAKSSAEVNAASGYARRRIAQFRSSLHMDSDNAARIKAAINQLQKAVQRGEKKKRELNREKLQERQKARSQEAKERMKQDLRRKKTQRMIRESGYLREANVSDRLATQLTETQMELRQQAQSISAAAAASLESAVQQYTGTVSAASAPPAPTPEISVQG